MKVAVVTRNPTSWSCVQLQTALNKRKIQFANLSFRLLTGRVGSAPYVGQGKSHIDQQFDALVIRPIGRGSLEEIVFRMDVLYKLQRLGLYVLNPPEAIEHCVDKYDILTYLEENGLPVPQTIVSEDVNSALEAFESLGCDVVVKPIFGSRGVGVTRITTRENALALFKEISSCNGVLCLQKYLEHGFSDIRTFVVGNRVIGAMRRIATSWKTNCSQGAKPNPVNLEKTMEDFAIRSAKAVDCKVAGVDILETSDGPVVLEVNSQPGWKGLQSVTSVNIADEIVDFVISDFRK